MDVHYKIVIGFLIIYTYDLVDRNLFVKSDIQKSNQFLGFLLICYLTYFLEI